jgi:hypothetical protein
MLAPFFFLLPVTGTKPRKSQAQNPRRGAELPIEVDLVGSSLSDLVWDEQKRVHVYSTHEAHGERNGRGAANTPNRKKKVCVGVLVEKRQVESPGKYSRRKEENQRWRSTSPMEMSLSQFANKVAHPLNYAYPPPS